MPKSAELKKELFTKRDNLARAFTQAKLDNGTYDFKKSDLLKDKDSKGAVEEIKKLSLEIEDLHRQVKDAEEIEGIEAKSLQFLEEKDKPAGGFIPPGASKGKGPVKSVGDMFAESAAFKGYQRGGGIGPTATLDVELKDLFQTGAGWAPESTRTGVMTPFATRPAPMVVNFIPQLPTSQAAIKYMEETIFQNNAEETAEAAQYKEVALKLEEKSVIVRKVTAWIPVTDEQLEDEPQVRGYLDQRLRMMLAQRLDLQVLTGAGTGILLLGTESVSGIQVQALGGDPIPDAIHKAFTKIRDDGFAEPSVVFIRPSKWQTVQLLKTADGIYIWGHPSQVGPSTIWGVPVVQTTAAPATKALTGDYQNHSTLYNRRGIDVQISNSHSDFFINGKLAIRADMRVAMVHYRPKAFAEVTGL